MPVSSVTLRIGVSGLFAQLTAWGDQNLNDPTETLIGMDAGTLTPPAVSLDTAHRYFLHRSSLFLTQNIAVSYTKHCCFLHKALLFLTQNIAVSYTRHCCFLHKTLLFLTQNVAVSHMPGSVACCHIHVVVCIPIVLTLVVYCHRLVWHWHSF